MLFGVLFSVYSLYLALEFYQENNSLTIYMSSQGSISLTVEEEPSGVVSDPVPTVSGGGGGGGTPTLPKYTEFNVDTESFNIQIVSGESSSEEIIIENIGDNLGFIDIEIIGVEDFLSLDKDNLVLEEGEDGSLVIGITAPEPGVYAGKIILTSGNFVKEIFILLNVISDDVLFDVSITIPDLYKTLQIGENLPTLIELLEIGDGEGLDVSLNYIIKDFEGNLIDSEFETLYIVGAKSFNKMFSTSILEAGDYVVGVELTYPGGFATSSAHFRISKTVVNYKTMVSLLLSLMALLIVIFSILYYKKISKKNKVIKKRKKGKSKK